MSVCGVDSCEVEDESVLEEKLTIEEQSVTAVQDAHSPYTSFTFFCLFIALHSHLLLD